MTDKTTNEQNSINAVLDLVRELHWFIQLIIALIILNTIILSGSWISGNRDVQNKGFEQAQLLTYLAIIVGAIIAIKNWLDKPDQQLFDIYLSWPKRLRDFFDGFFLKYNTVYVKLERGRVLTSNVKDPLPLNKEAGDMIISATIESEWTVLHNLITTQLVNHGIVETQKEDGLEKIILTSKGLKLREIVKNRINLQS